MTLDNYKRIKVVWVCHFSDKKIRQLLSFDKLYYRRFLHWITKKPLLVEFDYSSWISNAIRQFENFGDIELSIIFPHNGVTRNNKVIESNGIHYYCFRSEDDNIFSYIKSRLFKKYHLPYENNRKVISAIIKDINPDIVHFIGAENPYYSLAALDIPHKTPCLVSLQTLLSVPGFTKKSSMNKDIYDYRSQIEAQVINRCDYIASGSPFIRGSVINILKSNAKVLNLSLAVGVDITACPNENKEFDFVYFSGFIDKAGDDAVESFAIACKKHPFLTLNISGAYSNDFKSKLDARIQELGVKKNVIFTGAKSTHDEVLEQIKKARFALIPLKLDMISSTVREAMACGLPVVTTRTPGTPELNKDRLSVLLSEKGDYVEMAENICRLVEDESFSKRIRDNALLTVHEQYSNEIFMKKWRSAYYAILDEINYGKAIPESLKN